jgi:curved DNA-binding protein CbpA
MASVVLWTSTACVRRAEKRGAIGTVSMTTLYDVLGARAGDDAASLKSAFHKAVKESHPDLNTGDPQALSRFRQVVRANAILSDAEQRKIYDQMVEFERWRLHAKSKRGIVAETVRKLASDAITIAVLAAALTGGFAVFARLYHEPEPPVVMKAVEAAPDPIETASVKIEGQAVHVSREELQELLFGSGASGEANAINAPAPMAEDKSTRDIAPVDPAPEILDVAAPSKVAKAEPEPELHSRDPQFYRERAVISYRNGDLDGALTDLDQAIRLDPSSASAYIDRSIVLYRKAEIERALKDMATAMRIDRSRHASLPPAKPPKASAVLSKN